MVIFRDKKALPFSSNKLNRNFLLTLPTQKISLHKQNQVRRNSSVPRKTCGCTWTSKYLEFKPFGTTGGAWLEKAYPRKKGDDSFTQNNFYFNVLSKSLVSDFVSFYSKPVKLTLSQKRTMAKNLNSSGGGATGKNSNN